MELGRVLAQSAELVNALAGLQATARYPASPHNELKQVIAGLERINQTLQKAVAAGHLTSAQQGSIARSLERIAEAVEKGASSR